MREIIAISEDPLTGRTLFLGGGISDCPNWQSEIVQRLADTSLTLINPRRPDFPLGDPAAGTEQIIWEHKRLSLADAILFWFPEETVCPITLFELGAWSYRGKTLFVGTHPNYTRKLDVHVQLSLVRPEIEVVSSLEQLAAQVKHWDRKFT